MLSLLLASSVVVLSLAGSCRERMRSSTANGESSDIVKPSFLDVTKVIPEGEYYIFAQHSGLVLQTATHPEEWSRPSQPRVVQNQINGETRQKYWITQTSEKIGYYYIRSANSGLYWDIGGSTFDDHEALTEFRFIGEFNQQFRFDPIGNGTDLYRIVARHSNKVLDVHYNKKQNGVHVVQHNYNGGDNQKFRLVSAKVY